jgi:membrane protein implicated in regulation of membrane protease activity
LRTRTSREVLVATVFAIAAAVGSLLIVVQFFGGALDVEADGSHVDHVSDGADGLQLRSLRTIAVALAGFGFTGLILGAVGVWTWIALPVALAVGAAGLVGTALVVARLVALEQDASVRIADAIGERGTVYLPIAPEQPGKIQVVAGGRTVEYRAVAGETLATGTPVLVVGFQDAETVEVERA